MENSTYADQETAILLSRQADDEADRWLDQALEDTFPASDPLTPHSFD